MTKIELAIKKFENATVVRAMSTNVDELAKAIADQDEARNYLQAKIKQVTKGHICLADISSAERIHLCAQIEASC